MMSIKELMIRLKRKVEGFFFVFVCANCGLPLETLIGEGTKCARCGSTVFRRFDSGDRMRTDIKIEKIRELAKKLNIKTSVSLGEIIIDTIIVTDRKIECISENGIEDTLTIHWKRE